MDTVNGHSVPTFQDTRDTTDRTEWDALNAILTDCATVINTDGELSDGVTFGGGMTLGGDVTATSVAVDVDLKDNDSSALSFDAAGKTGILEIDTTNSAEKVKMAGGLDVTGEVTTAANVGVAGSGCTVEECGTARNHTTVITVSSNLGAITGGAAQGIGHLVYTLPAGAVSVDSAYISMALDEDDGYITADTPDVGLGTTAASGANATLDAVGAAAENILTGQTAADCNGTATVKTVADQRLVVEAGGDHTVYFNVADTWAASGEDDCAISGTITLHWHYMSA